LLARIDERELAAGVAAGDAGVAQAQAALAQARQNAQRTRELRAQGFVAAAALDTAQAQLDAAEAAVAAAQAGRQQAALARGHSSITAPFDGIVRATHAEAGELAAPGKPLLTLYAPGRLRASVMLPLSRAADARGAREVQVLLADGRVLVPQRRTELPGADAMSQTVEWRLDLAPPAATATAAEALMPGQPVRVRFVGAAAAASGAPLSIPAAALLRRGELTAVYAVAEGRFVLKAVRTGAPVAGQVPVLAGLKAGERIAADAVKAGLAGARPAN
jgi:RND family efflux transporter MFP subunit